MNEVVCVKVQELDSFYYLLPNDLELHKGDIVIFDNDGVLLCGRVCKELYSEKSSNLNFPLGNVLRIATKNDLKQIQKNSEVAKKALSEARELSVSLNLDMNFVDSYYFFDKSQLLFYFLSDNRIDFRELAKKLASKYKTRIELRQIGVRDKAKRIGGVGPCGLFLCCNSFLTDFNSVSINMAKNQLLVLNPTKINGICGRLLCCLGFENDNYTELKNDLPKIGMMAESPLGMGKVISLDIFHQTYTIDLGDKGTVIVSNDKK